MNKGLKTGLKVYKDYCAIKAHYSNPGYDYFVNKGITKASEASFEKRNDKAFFYTLAKKKDYLKYIIANIAYNNYWIGDIVMSDEADDNYNKFRKYNQSLKYTLKTDIKKLSPRFKDNFIVRDGQHPKILRMFVNNEISLETISILNAITTSNKYWDNHLGNDPLWQTYRLNIIKHEKFLAYRKDEVVDIILESCKQW